MTPAIDGGEVARLAKLVARARDAAGSASGLVRNDESSLGKVADVLLNRRPRAATGFEKAATAIDELASAVQATGDPAFGARLSGMAQRAAAAGVDAKVTGFATAPTAEAHLAQAVRDGRSAGELALVGDGFDVVRTAAGPDGATVDGATLGAAVLDARTADGSLAGADGALRDAARAADHARSSTHARPVRARRMLSESVREYATAWSRVDGDARLAGRATPAAVAATVRGAYDEHLAVPVVARRVQAMAAELHGAIRTAGPRASEDPLLVLQDHAWTAMRAANENLLAHGASSRRASIERAIAVVQPAADGIAAEATSVAGTLAKDSPARASLQNIGGFAPTTVTYGNNPNLFTVASINNQIADVARKLGAVRPKTAPDAAMTATEQLAVLDKARQHVQRARELWVSAGEHEYPTGATDMFGGSTVFSKTYRGWRNVAQMGLSASSREVGEAGSELIAARRLLARVVDEDMAGTGSIFDTAIQASADHIAAARDTVLNLDTMGTSWLTKHAVETIYPKHHDIGKTQAALTALDAMIDGMRGMTEDMAKAEQLDARPAAAAVAEATPAAANVATAADGAAQAAPKGDEAVLGF